MVIYLEKLKTIILKYLVVTATLILVFFVTYLVNFLKINNQKSVELNALKIENKSLNQDKKELSKFLNLDLPAESFVVSKVLLRDLHSFYNEIKINAKGVEVGDAVIDEHGLIGIVSKVDEKSASVKLLSGATNISVKINDTYGNLNAGIISMLDKYANIKEHDKVYTSGLTKIPADIYIGEVIKIYESSDNLGQVALIKLNNNEDLNYVAVLTGVQ